MSRDAGLAGRKALVTGASGGMGRAIAAALAGQGVACAVVGRDERRTEEAAAACGEAGTPAVAIVCDLADTAEVAAAVPYAIDALGGLNFLVNCAGIHVVAGAHEADLGLWDDKLDVNFRAAYHLGRHALPEIVKEPGGAVVNIGAITAPYAGGAMALASKRALAGYAEALFEDVREHGTKVCTIHPGWVNTAMAPSDRLDPERMIQPDDIVRTVLFVLTMPATACVTEITIRPQRTPYR